MVRTRQEIHSYPLTCFPDAPLHLKVTKRSDGSVLRIPVTHTMSADQLRWLRHGSALNYIRAVKSGEA